MTAFSDPQETQLEQYRALSSLAVVGLVLGLLSPAAILAPALWFVPFAAIPVCVLALQRIADEAPALVGRKAALVGLWLAVAFSVAAPVDWNLYRWMIRNEGRQFSTAFFDFLRENAPEKAHQLYINHYNRRPFDEHLWDSYVNDWDRYQDLKGFVALPAVRALLALGDQAQVRYYDTESQAYNAEDQFLKQVYAVTIPGQEGKQSFFVRLTLKRSPSGRSMESFWRIEQLEGGVTPVALGGTLKNE